MLELFITLRNPEITILDALNSPEASEDDGVKKDPVVKNLNMELISDSDDEMCGGNYGGNAFMESDGEYEPQASDW